MVQYLSLRKPLCRCLNWTLNNMISLYIHIPFCIKKCRYCDFLSFKSDAETIERYVEALCKEIASTGVGVVGANSEEPAQATIVETIFFGGGTPSVLSGEQIGKIMDIIKYKFNLSPKAEISMECNPGTAGLGKLIEYRKAGINRLSIGLQSGNDKELGYLGRIHSFRQFEETFKWARKAGFDNINIDIMSALPGQTLESYLDTLTKVVKRNPEHISAYSLIIEENSEFWDIYGDDAGVSDKKPVPLSYGEQCLVALDGIPSLPDEQTEREMYYITKDVLSRSGYHRYEISNYSKPGYECRHNKVYWTGKNYIGFGIGAASYINGIRYKNIEAIEQYMEYVECDKCRSIYIDENVLTLDERMEEFMFLGLRLTEGISKNEWRKNFGCEIEDVYGKKIEEFISDGLLQAKNDRIFLTDRGVDVSNIVLAEFLLES